MTSPTPPALRRTPLHARHATAGAHLVPFAGWELPLHYGSALREHLATRQGAGLFDVSHMGQIELRGPQAAELASRLASREATRLAPGEVRYALLLNDDGGLRDDLMLNRLAPDRLLLVVNAATDAEDLAYLQAVAAATRLEAELTGVSARYAMLALQGPQWLACAARALGREPQALARPPMRVWTLEHDGAELIVSTTGYTGEPGVELLCPPELAGALWDRLVAAGAEPVGLAARDSLRLEKGLALSGQDFTAATHPYEAGLGWACDLEGPPGVLAYPGLDALRRLKGQPLRRRCVGLAPHGKRIARHGAAVLKDGVVVGEVTSGGFSPCLDRPIAMGYVAAELATPGTELSLDLGRGTHVSATVRGRRHVE